MPEISVLMAECNTPPDYLREAVESILNQTYTDFEFIIVDDNTSQENKNILQEYQQQDARIKLIHNARNYGLTKSLNIGMASATGQYMARMDSDDVSMADRLNRQYLYMQEHDDVLVLGGISQILGTKKIALKPIDDFEVLKMRMIFYNCAMVHPTAFINLKRFRELGLQYNESVRKSQDYMLWSDCMMYGRIAVLPEIVLKTRIHAGQITQTARGEQQQFSMEIQQKLLRQYFGIALSKEQAKLHYQIIFGKYDSIAEVEKHFKWLMSVNQERKVFDIRAFKKECYFMWLLMVMKSMLYHKNFSCLKVGLTWKVFFSVVYWPYYLKYL